MKTKYLIIIIFFASLLSSCEDYEYDIKKWNSRASSQYSKGNYDKAIDYYNKSLESNYFNYYSDLAFESYERKGWVYYRMRNYSNAIKNYDDAIKINSQEHSVFFWRGSAHSHLRKYDEAIADYNTAIKLNPKERADYLKKIELNKRLKSNPEFEKTMIKIRNAVRK
ncbi:tetratricopeptide repeat protein [Flavobacteriaceae bacterium]|jgi:tetratricopeptide (TPR) repeat protein|nr:tetratricopeptide repeat protein [Flavobacteriaceae bacterium]